MAKRLVTKYEGKGRGTIKRANRLSIRGGGVEVGVYLFVLLVRMILHEERMKEHTGYEHGRRGRKGIPK